MLSDKLRNSFFVDHIVLVVSDVSRALKFYSKLLGAPVFSDDDSMMFVFGVTKLFLVRPYGQLPIGDQFNANRIGLEHLAFGVQSLNDLNDIETHLNSEGISHSGVHIDSHSHREKIWLNDPDGIRLEFFLRAD